MIELRMNMSHTIISQINSSPSMSIEKAGIVEFHHAILRHTNQLLGRFVRCHGGLVLSIFLLPCLRGLLDRAVEILDTLDESCNVGCQGCDVLLRILHGLHQIRELLFPASVSP